MILLLTILLFTFDVMTEIMPIVLCTPLFLAIYDFIAYYVKSMLKAQYLFNDCFVRQHS